MRIGEFQLIATEGRQSQAIVEPPIGAGRSRLLQVGSIDGAQAIALCQKGPVEAGPSFPREFAAKTLEPGASRAQALEQGHIGNLGQSLLARAHARLAQGETS